MGILALFCSAWAGLFLGSYVARFITTRLLTTSENFGKRLAAAFSAFGFVYLPHVVGSWTNTFLNTNMDMGSSGEHFSLACLGAVIFFCVSPAKSEN